MPVDSALQAPDTEDSPEAPGDVRPACRGRRCNPRSRPNGRWRKEAPVKIGRTFTDLGQTLAELFDVGRLAHGVSFRKTLVAEPDP